MKPLHIGLVNVKLFSLKLSYVKNVYVIMTISVLVTLALGLFYVTQEAFKVEPKKLNKSAAPNAKSSRFFFHPSNVVNVA